MAAAESTSSAETFGYITVFEHRAYGFFGGYLIVCNAGRPLEFHCSTPVKPSRAQEILYGPTLRSYVLGQQIGGGLLANAGLKPNLIITDQPEILVLRPQSELPWVLLVGTGPSPESPVAPLRSPRHFNHAGCDFELPVSYDGDIDSVRSLLARLSQSVHLAEPFERIELAIREAQRIGECEPEGEVRVA